MVQRRLNVTRWLTLTLAASGAARRVSALFLAPSGSEWRACMPCTHVISEAAFLDSMISKRTYTYASSESPSATRIFDLVSRNPRYYVACGYCYYYRAG